MRNTTTIIGTILIGAGLIVYAIRHGQHEAEASARAKAFTSSEGPMRAAMPGSAYGAN